MYVTEQVSTLISKLGSSRFRVSTSETIRATPVLRGAMVG